MANNFINGINLITDPTGNTRLANHLFYSVDGNDSNDGTDPSAPKLNLPTGIALGGLIYVLGSDQVYTTNEHSNGKFLGDGIAILDGEGTEDLSHGNGNLDFENIIVRNWQNLNWNTLPTGNVFMAVKNSMFLSNSQTSTITTINPTRGWESFFVNHNIRLICSAGSYITRGVFYNCSPQLSFTDDTGRIDSHLFVNCNIRMTESHIQRLEYCNFVNCTFTIGEFTYSSISELRADIPLALPNLVEGDPSLLGSLDRLEYRTVAVDSVLLGAGKFGVNIGNVNLGAVFNVDSTGTVFTNTRYTGQILEQIDQGIVGLVTYVVVEFPRVVSDPILYINGISDFLNNVPRITILPTNPSKPSKRTVQIRTAGTDGILGAVRFYREGFRISRDGSQKASGENEYHELNPIRENVKFALLQIELNS